MMKNPPTVTRLIKADTFSEWRITRDGGKTYFVTTYPDSNLLFVRSASTGRVISNAPKLRTEIRAAVFRFLLTPTEQSK